MCCNGQCAFQCSISWGISHMCCNGQCALPQFSVVYRVVYLLCVVTVSVRSSSSVQYIVGYISSVLQRLVCVPLVQCSISWGISPLCCRGQCAFLQFSVVYRVVYLLCIVTVSLRSSSSVWYIVGYISSVLYRLVCVPLVQCGSSWCISLPVGMACMPVWCAVYRGFILICVVAVSVLASSSVQQIVGYISSVVERFACLLGVHYIVGSHSFVMKRLYCLPIMQQIIDSISPMMVQLACLPRMLSKFVYISSIYQEKRVWIPLTILTHSLIFLTSLKL